MSSGMKCANCGKGVAYGHNVSHAKNKTNRLFAPNLHWARVMLEAKMQRLRLCTKCLRKMKKEVSKKSTSISSIIPAVL